MSTTSEQRGAPGDNEVDTTHEADCQRWAEKLGVSVHQLKAAVDAVGPNAQNVERYLRSRGHVSRSA
jgi:hypothetical protein